VGHKQEKHALDHPDGLPAFLSIDFAVLSHQTVRDPKTCAAVSNLTLCFR
jgi:hypothetical protein